MKETFLYKSNIVTLASCGCLLLMNKKKCVISTGGRNLVLEKARSLAKARDDKEIVWILIE